MKRYLFLTMLWACSGPVDCPEVEKMVFPYMGTLIPESTPPIKYFIGFEETHFKIAGKDEGRAANITLAASRLHLTIEPGEELSFNDAVGPRTEENGFVSAPTIFMGETVDDIGGGVCQVSSTLHAAALFSGLEIVSRQPHTRPSKYIRTGLDATVAFPAACNGNHRENIANGKNKDCYSVDLVIRNPFSFPVVLEPEIIGFENGGKTVAIIIKGSDYRISHVGYKWFPGKREDYKRRVRKTSKYKLASYQRIAQHGEPGVEGKSVVTLELEDGGEVVRTYNSKYPPTDEIWHVGLEYNLAGPPPWEGTSNGSSQP